MNELHTLKQKAARYCAWRERCLQETAQKLELLGASPEQKEKVLQWLQQEKYLDDNRFAGNFVRSKFHNNHWGRNRLYLELKARSIAEDTIRQALREIPENEYISTLQLLALKKWEQQGSQSDVFIKKQKTAAYLCQKGFEQELAWQAVEELQKT